MITALAPASGSGRTSNQNFKGHRVVLTWLEADGVERNLKFPTRTISTSKFTCQGKIEFIGKHACGRGLETEFHLLRLSNETISSADSIGSASQFVSPCIPTGRPHTPTPFSEETCPVFSSFCKLHLRKLIVEGCKSHCHLLADSVDLDVRYIIDSSRKSGELHREGTASLGSVKWWLPGAIESASTLGRIPRSLNLPA